MSALRRLSWLILPGEDFVFLGILLEETSTSKMDEDLDLEKRAIEALSVVSSVRFHAGDKTHKTGYHANLRCGCGAKQVGPIRISSKFPTLRDC